MTPGDEATGTPLVTDVTTLLAQHGENGYREFLGVPALSLGLFVTSAGHVDEQKPHDRDEVYVILAGEAVLEIAGLPHPVSAGSMAYVPAGVRHHFAEIRGDLRVLVFFAGSAR